MARGMNLALVGPTLSGSNDELAVMAESGISPEFIPSAVRHSPSKQQQQQQQNKFVYSCVGGVA